MTWQGPLPKDVGTVMEWHTTADGKAVAVPASARADSSVRPMATDAPIRRGRFRMLVGRFMSAALYNLETFETTIRVSNFIDPAILEVHPDDDGKSPTVRVKYVKGRFTNYGTVDRDALDECRAEIRRAAGSVTGA